jgi:sulfopropanediol 3-dehydrogenase
MARYLKQGRDHIARPDPDVGRTVAGILDDIAARGEDAVRDWSVKLDGWDPPEFRVGDEAIERACAAVPAELAGHIDAAAAQIGGFARAQRDSLADLEVEVGEGVVLGHRWVPVGNVGAYIPGGRYKLISSALMSVLVAKVAGVGHVTAATPAGPDGIPDATLYALRAAGADAVYAIGGVQALAALAHGALPGIAPVDLLVGAGNAYVAEAKRQLFGLVGIDLLAGPTEILVIADETARPTVVAADLLGQAEHGPTSPAMLVALTERTGRAVADEIERLLVEWPTAEVAGAAWRDFGTVVVADDADEAVRLSDAFAPEHLQIQVEDPAWYEAKLRNYGTIFVGDTTNVTFGDKAVGTNHTLPTALGARYTGGLWVGSYLKMLTFQRLTSEASRRIAVPSVAISRAEGLPGHAISAELRLDLERHPRLID